MKSIQIRDSYDIWNPFQMSCLIANECKEKYNTVEVEYLFNRKEITLYIEWWLHNIGYYVSLPLVRLPYFEKINHRCKHVDLEEWGGYYG